MILIEDSLHGEIIGKYPNFAEAVSELKKLANIPWDKDPNRAPCMSWKTCERTYCLVDGYNYISALNIGSAGVSWIIDPKKYLIESSSMQKQRSRLSLGKKILIYLGFLIFLLLVAYINYHLIILAFKRLAASFE